MSVIRFLRVAVNLPVPSRYGLEKKSDGMILAHVAAARNTKTVTVVPVPLHCLRNSYKITPKANKRLRI